jgi:hypothetical protein
VLRSEILEPGDHFGKRPTTTKTTTTTTTWIANPKCNAVTLQL